jgi:hypothetical protein
MLTLDTPILKLEPLNVCVEPSKVHKVSCVHVHVCQGAALTCQSLVVLRPSYSLCRVHVCISCTLLRILEAGVSIVSVSVEWAWASRARDTHESRIMSAASRA